MSFEHALTPLVAATGGWWSRLSDNWRAILVLAAAVAVGWTASQTKEDLIGRGSLIQENTMKIDTLQARMDDFAQWIIIHEDTVATPGLEAVRDLRIRDSLRTVQIDTMFMRLERLYCLQFPESCPPRLRRSGG